MYAVTGHFYLKPISGVTADAVLHKVIVAFAQFEHSEWLEWGSALMPSLMVQIQKEEEDVKVAKELEWKKAEQIMHEAQEKKEVDEREATIQKVVVEVVEKKWGIMGRWRAKEISLAKANEAIAAFETPLDAPCITTGSSMTGGGMERDMGPSSNEDEAETEETVVPVPLSSSPIVGLPCPSLHDTPCITAHCTHNSIICHS